MIQYAIGFALGYYAHKKMSETTLEELVTEAASIGAEEALEMETELAAEEAAIAADEKGDAMSGRLTPERRRYHAARRSRVRNRYKARLQRLLAEYRSGARRGRRRRRGPAVVPVASQRVAMAAHAHPTHVAMGLYR